MLGPIPSNQHQLTIAGITIPVESILLFPRIYCFLPSTHVFQHLNSVLVEVTSEQKIKFLIKFTVNLRHSSLHLVQRLVLPVQRLVQQHQRLLRQHVLLLAKPRQQQVHPLQVELDVRTRADDLGHELKRPVGKLIRHRLDNQFN